MIQWLSPPARRLHITQKIKIAGRRTLYICHHGNERPAEMLLRVKGSDCLQCASLVHRDCWDCRSGRDSPRQTGCSASLVNRDSHTGQKGC